MIQLEKVDKINKIIIITYGLTLFYLIIHSSFRDCLLQGCNLIISVSILLFMDQKMKKEPIMHRSPIYYYAFPFFATYTIFLTGGYKSLLFPILFLFPVVYSSINFPRKGSTGIAILINVVMLLFLKQDPLLRKWEQVAFLFIILFIIPQAIGLLIKHYKFKMSRMTHSNQYFREN